MSIAEPATIPFIPWREFRASMQWRQGEHVTLIGHTGAGKTELLIRLLSLRSYVAVFGTKGRDTTMDQLLNSGYTRLTRWQGDVSDHVVLWPKMKGLRKNSIDEQREIFVEALDSIYRAGGWCLAIDEITYFAEMLRMEYELKFLLQQGRSSGISVIGGTQRPAWIPLAFYSMATHLFFWRTTDQQDVRRISEISGPVDKNLIMEEVQNLKGAAFEKDTRETLYVNVRTGYICKTIVQL